MKYYIKVENDYITDIITYEYGDYLEIELNLSDYDYAIHSGLYTYKNETIELDKIKEEQYLKEQEELISDEY